MPSIGTRIRSDNNLMVTTKIHGPTTTFMFDPKDILQQVKRIVDSSAEPEPKKLATEIVNSVADFVDYDPNAVWVDCEVLSADGILYSDVVDLRE